MQGIILRDYQQAAVDRLRQSFASGRRAPLLVLPTGGGKTICFCYVAEQASARGSRVLILVHRQELLKQCSRALDRLGVPHGLIAAGCAFSPRSVQVASVQTLVRRMHRLPWRPDLIVIDEAHHAVAGSWRKVIDHYSGARLLGVTATPARLDGRGLGDVFDDLVEGPTIRQLTAQGFLTSTKIYAPPVNVDLSRIASRAGDFAKEQLSAAMDRPTITGDAIAHYRRICPGVPAIAFCVSVEHARHVAEQFRQTNFRAESLDGSMDDRTRARLIDDLGAGRLQVLTSCDIVSEGTDIPTVHSAILLRPTQSESLYLQQVGRVLRPAEGKAHAIILDHVGNVIRHGLPDDDRDWTLEGRPRRGRRNDAPAPSVRQCPTCYAAHAPAPVCPSCGHAYETAREVRQVDGELVELDPSMVTRQRRREQGSAQTLEQLIQLGRQRGYKNPAAWAQHVYAARRSRPAVGWA